MAGVLLQGLRLTAGRRLVTLRLEYYFGHIWCAMNAVGLGQLEAAQQSIQEVRRLVPKLSLTMVRRVLGAMSHDVDEP